MVLIYTFLRHLVVHCQCKIPHYIKFKINNASASFTFSCITNIIIIKTTHPIHGWQLTWVVVTNGTLEKTLAVLCRIRRDDLEAGHTAVPCSEALRVLSSHASRWTIGATEHNRDWHLQAGHAYCHWLMATCLELDTCFSFLLLQYPRNLPSCCGK